MSDQPRAAIRYNGGLWSVTLTHSEYSEHIPDFRTKEDAQFYVDARFREWGYAPQPRHLHEYDADAEAALLAENRRLSERCEQLEGILQVLVNFGWLDVNQYGNAYECQHCNIEAQLGVNLDEYPHAPNCVIAQAKAMLGEDGHG